METRRNRLRVLAFRRGLLAPDYPNGIQSRIREEWVLDLLEREYEAEYTMSKLLMKEIMLAPIIDRKHVIDHMKDVGDRVDWLKDFSLGSLKKYLTAEEKLLNGSGGLINVWKNLAKSGKLAEIQERMTRLYEAYTQQQDYE